MFKYSITECKLRKKLQYGVSGKIFIFQFKICITTIGGRGTFCNIVLYKEGGGQQRSNILLRTNYVNKHIDYPLHKL